MVLLAKMFANSVAVTDVEFWGGWHTRVVYEEAWNEDVPCNHDVYCTETVRNSDGTTSTNSYVCGKEHMYDVDDHPPKWYAFDSNGDSFSVSRDKFDILSDRWGNREFVDMRRDYHSDDGDKYVSKWDGKDKTMEPSVSVHRYANKVQESDSTIFGFSEVSELEIEEYGLYRYPQVDGRYCQSILGSGPRMASANRMFDVANAKIGASKFVFGFCCLIASQGKLA